VWVTACGLGAYDEMEAKLVFVVDGRMRRRWVRTYVLQRSCWLEVSLQGYHKLYPICKSVSTVIVVTYRLPLVRR
jgi:hypothetical protein